MDKVEVLNVNVPGRVSRVDAAKYEAMKRAILEVVPAQAPGLLVRDAGAKPLRWHRT